MSKKDLFFVHIPKNAGEFVKHNYGYAVYTNDDFNLPIHAKFADAKRKDLTPFAIVRDPYQRLESQYYYQKSLDRVMADMYFPTFERYILNKLFEKETLSERVRVGPQDKSSAKRRIFEGLILEPQTRFTGDISPENIIRYENFQTEFTLFLEKHNIEIGDDWRRVNKTRDRKTGGWTSQMKSIVRNYYELDFTTHGY